MMLSVGLVFLLVAFVFMLLACVSCKDRHYSIACSMISICASIVAGILRSY